MYAPTIPIIKMHRPERDVRVEDTAIWIYLVANAKMEAHRDEGFDFVHCEGTGG